MNSLSWMIYLAGVTGNLKVVLVVGAVLTLLASTVIAIYGAAIKDDDRIKVGDEVWLRGHALHTLALKKLGPAALAILLLSSFVPASSTIYAIAASEMGEAALNTETGGKAVKALNAWLDRQIEGDQPEAGQSK